MMSDRVKDISAFRSGCLRDIIHPPQTDRWRSGSVRIFVQNGNATGKVVEVYTYIRRFLKVGFCEWIVMLWKN